MRRRDALAAALLLPIAGRPRVDHPEIRTMARALHAARVSQDDEAVDVAWKYLRELVARAGFAAVIVDGRLLMTFGIPYSADFPDFDDEISPYELPTSMVLNLDT